MRDISHNGTLLGPLVALAVCAASCGARPKPAGRDVVVPVSLCDLRNSRERYGGKTVQVEGWIYTDLERFLLSDGGCAVPLENQDPKPAGLGIERLDSLLKEAKKGSFNTSEDVFSVVVGRFLTEETKIGNDVWKPALSPSQSVLLIQRVVCSAVAPMTANTKAVARSTCQQ
jgi:hypothetical protein